MIQLTERLDELEESVKLSEGLKDTGYNVWYTDYVGDIVNWLVNKPICYRIIYYAPADIWAICNALNSFHAEMIQVLDDCGIIDIEADGYEDYDDAFSDEDNVESLMFTPAGEEDELTGRFSADFGYHVELISGTLAFEKPEDIYYGACNELLDKLVQRGAVKNPELHESVSAVTESLKELYYGCYYTDYEERY